MSKGIAALSYLPAVDIILDATLGSSVESIIAAVKKAGQVQASEPADGTLSGVIANGTTPYNNVTIDIVVGASGAEYDVTLTAVNDLPALDSIGRAALSTRRNITVDLANAGSETFTFRSLLAVLNFIQKLEDKVAQTGDSAEGDGTYTSISVKGHSPYESFEWTVVKLADAYTLTPTSGS